MNTVGELLTHISGQLSDQTPGREFSRWPKKVLLEYLREGCKEIAAYKPEEFATTLKVRLAPGSAQTLSKVLENPIPDDKKVPVEVTKPVLAGVSYEGVPAGKVDMGLLRTFSNYAVCTSVPKQEYGRPVYKMRGYATDINNKDTFYVTPEVPMGINPIVSLTLHGASPLYTEAHWGRALEVPEKHYNNLVDYIMARAYQRDTESSVSQTQSQRLFSLFYQALGQKYKMDSARNSGYYNGEIGRGDPRARA